MDLSEVCGQSLGNCISNLSKVNMERTTLSMKQLRHFFNAVSESTVLKELDLFDVIIMDETHEEQERDIIANLLTAAICRLQLVNISYGMTNASRLCQFYTTDTLIKFFESCLLSTMLKELYCRIDVCQVPCDLFAQVMCHLHKANFASHQVRSEQLEALFQQHLRSSMLKELIILSTSNIDSSLSELPPGLLGKSISKLESIFIPSFSLTTDQVIAIVNSSINSNTLKSINLACGNLSDVHTIPETTCHLQRLNLQRTNLSCSQTAAILRASLDSTTLKELNLGGLDLCEVPAGLLSQALCRLRKVAFGSGGEGVTLEQCNHFLASSLSSIMLEDLTIFSDNIPGVSAHLIGKAVTRLRRSNMEYNDLSKEQLSSILGHSIHSQTLVEIRLSHTNIDTLRKISLQGTSKDILIDAKNLFCTSDLFNQYVVMGRDWGRGKCDISNIASGEEDGGEVGVVVKTRIEFSEKGDYWGQKAKGLVSVVWSNGNSSICRMGRGEYYDIKLHQFSGNLEWFD